MPLRRWPVAATMAALMLAVLVGCSSKGTPAEPRRPLDTTAAAGSTVVSDDAEGFAVSIPTAWVKMPTEVGKFDAAADAVRAQAPPASAAAVDVGLYQLKSAVRSGVSIAAIDTQTGTTANLVTLASKNQKVDEIAVAAGNELRQNGDTNFERRPVTVDGIAGVRQRFVAPFPGASGPVNLNESQLYVARRGHVFILTLAGDSPDVDGIANSLKLA